MRKKVPGNLLRMIDDYLSDRWVIFDGDKWSLNEEMTCGTPQRSRVGRERSDLYAALHVHLYTALQNIQYLCAIFYESNIFLYHMSNKFSGF